MTDQTKVSNTDDTKDSDDNVKTPLISITKEKVDLRKKEKPLVDVKVTNPVEYLRKWWKRVMGNEGIDFRFRIRPITAIAITIVICALSLGIARIQIPFDIPFFEYLPEVTPIGIVDQQRETAFLGVVKYSPLSQKFYLLTSTSEAIKLDVPDNIDLDRIVGRRIFVTGLYDVINNVLYVVETEDMEIVQATTIPAPLKSVSPIIESNEEAEAIVQEPSPLMEPQVIDNDI